MIFQKLTMLKFSVALIKLNDKKLKNSFIDLLTFYSFYMNTINIVWNLSKIKYENKDNFFFHNLRKLGPERFDSN